MPLLFSAQLFLSAALLFFVELMFGSMILPKFGGAPAVWNTCMVFFQAAMLAGYSYAHWMPTWLGVKRQSVVHLGLLLLPIISLPIAANLDPPGDGNPILWVLLLLSISVGLPFFMIATSAPLLQKWFTHTGHPSAKDPYFLYAASNLGSMLALFAYPSVVEHYMGLGLRTQSLYWTAGYGLLCILMVACAYAVWTAPDPTEQQKKKQRPTSSDLETTPPTPLRILWWVGLAFVPSSLMLGCTTYLSTDLSPGPMIWVLPLGLYLLSFILVFSRLPLVVHTLMILSLPVLILLQAYLMLSETDQSKTVLITLHALTLFVVSMVCHGELARNRPDPKYLTAFYLWMSVGGVLGGMFNALVAPLIFNTVVEYPLVMAAACLLMPKLEMDKPGAPGRWREFVIPAVLGVLVAALLFQGTKDVDRSIKGWRESRQEAEKAGQQAETTREVLDNTEEGDSHDELEKVVNKLEKKAIKLGEEVVKKERMLLLLSIAMIFPPLFLVLAGKICYDSLSRITTRKDFGQHFLICLFAGGLVGCLIHLPSILLAKKIDSTQSQLIDEAELKAQESEVTKPVKDLIRIVEGRLTKQERESDKTKTPETARAELEQLAQDSETEADRNAAAQTIRKLDIDYLTEWKVVASSYEWWCGIPLAMAFLCLLLPYTSGTENSRKTYYLDLAMALFFALFVAMHLVMLNKDRDQWNITIWQAEKLQGFLRWMYDKFPQLAKTLHLPPGGPTWQHLSTVLEYGIPILLCYAWVTRPIRFGLGVGAIMLGAAFYALYYNDDILLRDRSFFGVLKLEKSMERMGKDERVYYHRLVHGTTLHGKQETDEDGYPIHNAKPLTYYHETGPIGQVFKMIEKTQENRPFALIGLGTGTTAYYGKPGQELVFYEIDSKVKAIAENPNYFSYLSDAKDRGVNLKFVMGDARLSLKKDPKTDDEGRPDNHFRLIVVDAFSSDAIPKHLITYEALELYLQKLADDGVIAFHISNRYLDLEPVLSTLAKKAKLKCLVRHDGKEDHPGKAASTWVILARSEHYEKAFGSLLADVKETRKDDKKWYWIEKRKEFREDTMDDVKLWTDDYQNILDIFMW